MLTIVIPTYNERENIKILIPRIFQVLRKNKINGKVLVVDDNSPDGTTEEVKKLKKKYPVGLIVRKEKLGLGSAYILGFKKVLKSSDLIMEMDADLSHDPKYIPKFIEAIKNNDVVIGSRYNGKGRIIGWNWYRKFVSKTGNLIGKYIAGIGISDLTSGYRIFRKVVLKKINLNKIKSQSYDFQLKMLSEVLHKGFRVSTIPITFYERKLGKSKLPKVDALKFSLTALRIRLKKIYK